MCGRYGLVATDDEFESWAAGQRELKIRVNRNVAPTTKMPILTSGPTWEAANWWLVPRWSKDGKYSFTTFNARVETLETAASFRNLVFSQRCLVPFSFFYEWKTEGKVKTPIRITPQDNKLHAFAGLFDIWKGDGRQLQTFTIITRPARPDLEWLHSRMPLVLNEEHYKQWLNPAADKQLVRDLLLFEPDIALNFIEDDPRLNKAGWQPENPA